VVVGSHGAGDPSETLTPLIAWGAGLRSPEYIEPSSANQHSPPGTVNSNIIINYNNISIISYSCTSFLSMCEAAFT